jgi:hypothetical protein
MDPGALERLPGLGAVLRRGQPLPAPEGVSAACCLALGISRQRDWPVAPFTARAAGLKVGEDYWLRLDPVCLDVSMRGPWLRAGQALEEEEARALHGLVAPILSPAGYEILAGQGGVLHMRCKRAPRLDTTPLDQVDGRLPTPFLPRGEEAPTWVRLLHEVQMALHEHPINQARAATGRLPINSLWPWGGGRYIPPARLPEGVWSDLPLLQQLAAAVDVPVAPAPDSLAQFLAAPGLRGVVALSGERDGAHAPDLLETWEQTWLRPLQGALRRGRLASAQVDLLGPGAVSRRMTPLQAWRLWA